MMPREKLVKNGVANLSDFELLRLLIGSGNGRISARGIAARVTKLLEEKGEAVTLEDLLRVKGMGVAKASEIIALFELGKRYLTPDDSPIISNTEEAVAQLSNIRSKKQEYFAVITLDGANRIISNTIVFQGTLTQSLVHPREVFAKAIEDRAASIIIAHNHPSGDVDPSPEDIETTHRLKEAGQLLGIKVLEHIVLTKDAYFSI